MYAKKGVYMKISENTRKAYSEVDVFLNLLPEDKRDKVPENVRKYFKEEKDDSYKKSIDPNVDIKDQNLKSETLSIIAALNLKYWCEDEEERKRLIDIYTKNEEIYNDSMKFDIDVEDIFKDRSNNIDKANINKEKQEKLIEYKNSRFKTVINKLLKIIDFKK